MLKSALSSLHERSFAELLVKARLGRDDAMDEPLAMSFTVGLIREPVSFDSWRTCPVESIYALMNGRVP